jgi:hypothetical protein
LFWIVLVALLPLAILCFAILLQTASAQKEQSTLAAARVLRNITLEIEAEVQASAAALDALSASPRLAARGFEDFYSEANALLERRSDWANVVLSDASAHQIINTRIPLGSPLPADIYGNAITEAMRTHRTVVSDITFSPTLHAYVFAVAVPVSRGGAVEYVLTAAIRPTAIQNIITTHNKEDRCSL